MTCERQRCRGDNHKPNCAHLGLDPDRRRCRGEKHAFHCDHVRAAEAAKTADSGRDLLKTDDLGPDSESPETGGSSGMALPDLTLIAPYRGHPGVIDNVSPAREKRWRWNDPCPHLGCGAPTRFGYCTNCRWVCPNDARPEPEP